MGDLGETRSDGVKQKDLSIAIRVITGQIQGRCKGDACAVGIDGRIDIAGKRVAGRVRNLYNRAVVIEVNFKGIVRAAPGYIRI